MAKYIFYKKIIIWNLFKVYLKFRMTPETKSIMQHLTFFLIYVVLSDWANNLKKLTSKSDSYSHTILDFIVKYTHVTSSIIAVFFTVIIFRIHVRKN